MILSHRSWTICLKFISVTPPASCTLCPRRCRADRAAGQVGFCGAGRTLKAARAALHFWEEPCISGTRGSGTVFFSGCTLKCCFCQNYPISAEGLGREITPEHLAEIFLDLQRQGAHNINLVTPGQWRPWIIAALDHRPGRGAASAHRLQHRRLRDGGERGGVARLHRHLAGRPEIRILFPLRRAFRCAGLLRTGQARHRGHDGAGGPPGVRRRGHLAERRHPPPSGPARPHRRQLRRPRPDGRVESRPTPAASSPAS